MITAFMATHELHAVHVIKREGMTKIRASAFCTIEEDAGPGIYQVPDWAFDGRSLYGKIPVCVKCSRAAISLRTPPQ